MVLPGDWTPAADLRRTIVHWTAGSNKASSIDRQHYHILIEGDGKLVRGVPTIAANAVGSVLRPRASHTLNCNTGSIGVSLCGMRGAVERPFKAGPSPITTMQWTTLAHVLAQLCRRYRIAPVAQSLLTHAEVQSNLSIAQRGKWDIGILPFEPELNTPKLVGDRMRAMTEELMRSG
jgi:N-acetyl-anhydromuramyl-L-alanine amidase AmpD